MKPANISTFNITKGNTYNEILVFNEREDNVVTPLDLTQYTNIKQDIRRRITINSELLHSCDLTDGISISGSDNNILNIIIPSTEVATWNGGTYYRDITVTDGWGHIYTYCTGKIQVRENITE